MAEQYRCEQVAAAVDALSDQGLQWLQDMIGFESTQGKEHRIQEYCRQLLADIGHYGSEQFTMDLIQRRLGEVFPTFAVRLTEIVTDPIYHF